jgi:hypothetical protein
MPTGVYVRKPRSPKKKLSNSAKGWVPTGVQAGGLVPQPVETCGDETASALLEANDDADDDKVDGCEAEEASDPEEGDEASSPASAEKVAEEEASAPPQNGELLINARMDADEEVEPAPAILSLPVKKSHHKAKPKTEPKSGQAGFSHATRRRRLT